MMFPAGTDATEGSSPGMGTTASSPTNAVLLRPPAHLSSRQPAQLSAPAGVPPSGEGAFEAYVGDDHTLTSGSTVIEVQSSVPRGEVDGHLHVGIDGTHEVGTKRRVDTDSPWMEGSNESESHRKRRAPDSQEDGLNHDATPLASVPPDSTRHDADVHVHATAAGPTTGLAVSVDTGSVDSCRVPSIASTSASAPVENVVDTFTTSSSLPARTAPLAFPSGSGEAHPFEPIGNHNTVTGTEAAGVRDAAPAVDTTEPLSSLPQSPMLTYPSNLGNEAVSSGPAQSTESNVDNVMSVVMTALSSASHIVGATATATSSLTPSVPNPLVPSMPSVAPAQNIPASAPEVAPLHVQSGMEQSPSLQHFQMQLGLPLPPPTSLAEVQESNITQNSMSSSGLAMTAEDSAFQSTKLYGLNCVDTVVNAMPAHPAPTLAIGMPQGSGFARVEGVGNSGGEVDPQAMQTVVTKSACAERVGLNKRRNRNRPTCNSEGCQLRPLFGVEGSRQAVFCSQHKAPGMINVRCRRCEVEGCTHQPSFGIEGGRAMRCASHKTLDMVNVAAPRCKFPRCMVCPSFGRPGERKASFCATHRREGDIDLVTRRCHHEGCIHRPVFGHPSEKRAYYCAAHKLAGMVNVFAQRCIFPGCTHQPSWGVPNERPSHCAKHRTQGHVNKR